MTALTYATDASGLHHLVIRPTQGAYQGQLPVRSYELHIHAAGKPTSISVDGKELGPGTWDAAQATAVVALPKRAIRDGSRWRGAEISGSAAADKLTALELVAPSVYRVTSMRAHAEPRSYRQSKVLFRYTDS